MADDSLVGEIQAYAQRYLSPEMQIEIDASLSLCDAFESDTLYQTIQNVIFDQSTATTELQLETFLAEINHAMDALLKAHSIEVTEATPLHRKNELLTALYRFQHYEDTHALLRILEGSINSEEKLGQVISLLTTMDVSVFLETVESFDPSLITAMTNFLEDKESKLDQYEAHLAQKNTQLTSNLKHFFTFFGHENLATEILNTGIETGYTLDLYLGHFKDFLITSDDESTAMNLLSLFMLASDSHLAPLDAYRQHSEALVIELTRRITIEAKLKDLVTSFTNYKEALDVAKRVSSV